jgi:hypothetical protein
MSLGQPETPIQGVKRKRTKSSNRQSHSKKQKSSHPLTLETPNNSTDAFQDEDDGAQHPTRKEIFVEIPSRQSKGMLTPISKRKKNMIRAREVLPICTTENPDKDSIRREPELSVDSDAKIPLQFLGDMQSGLMCSICGMEFANPKSLKRHLANPRIHRKWHKCGNCEEAFYQPGDLKIHQDESGHNTRAHQSGESRGPFTEREKVKLTRFKRRFCNDHSISEFEFNKLMTLLGRRDGSDWPNPDVTKTGLRDMFYDVLPDRNKKSMNRYRERYFQNVEQDTEWTEKHINELRSLVKEKGRKWVEIAEVLGRTQDSVYQKWKNRIRQGDAQRFDRWEEEEIQALILAVKQCKTAAGVAQDISSDDRVNWTSVSDLLGKRRNAQQCSTFWKRVYRKREEAKARGKHLRPLTPGRSKPEPAISQRQSRSRVTRGGESVEVTTPRRRIKSAMYVTESDDENTAPAENAKPKKGKKRVSSDTDSTIPHEENEVEDGADGRQSAETAEQEEADENEDVDDDDGEGENNSPSKNSQPNRLGERVNSSSAELRNSSELQPGFITQLRGSFQAVNSPSLKCDFVAPRSSLPNEMTRLPPLSKKTPKQIKSLSQAFNNTQALTPAGTRGRSTSGKRLTQDRPSPDIKMRLKPLQEESNDLESQEGSEEETGQPETAVPNGLDFAIYDSEAEDSDEGASAQILSSAASLRNQNTSAEAEAEGKSDSEGQFSDNEQTPQMFSSGAVQDVDEATGAELSQGSEVEEMETIQNGAEYKTEENSEDEPPPQTFDSAALTPNASDGSDAAELKSEDCDNDDPPHTYSSTLPPEPASQPPEAYASDTNEETEAETEEDEDDDSPPEMFTSALPDEDGDEEDAASSDSSGDAATIPPYGSDDDDYSHNNDAPSSSSESESESEEFSDNDNGSGSSGDGNNDTDQSMIDATQTDFFANLEASAKKVRLEREMQAQMRKQKQMRMERANIGRKVGGGNTRRSARGGSGDGSRSRTSEGSGSAEKKDGMKGKKKDEMKGGKRRKKKMEQEVFDVTSSSSGGE